MLCFGSFYFFMLMYNNFFYLLLCVQVQAHFKLESMENVCYIIQDFLQRVRRMKIHEADITSLHTDDD